MLGDVPARRRCANYVVCPCWPRKVGDAEEVDESAVGNLLLHGDARDTSFCRFVRVSDARSVLGLDENWTFRRKTKKLEEAKITHYRATENRERPSSEI
ncbi:hypothetical protein EAI_00182, partial [Harpegnathos saltator]